MAIHVHNTLSRRKELFVPADPDRVTMYVCGPTVYSHPHIGNARPAVVFDLLYRSLKRRFAKVVYARNITDVDDKINRAAKNEDVAIDVISRRFTDIYHQDMRALGVLEPDVEPRATQHIPEMIQMAQKLIDQGYAYEEQEHVLFEVARFEGYGQLSGRNRREMIAGARVEVAPYKRDPADFVLWKPAEEGAPGWESPWGRGRPGWHLECSAMSAKHLGQTLDIHGGGADLQFPHHENELAQSTCAHGGATFARYWMHNGFVNIDNEKMAKSIGNILLVKDLLAQAPGEVMRLALLSTHYRKPLDWSADTVEQAETVLHRLYEALDGEGGEPCEPETLDVPEEIESALDDDLNSPLAISRLRELSQRIAAENSASVKRKLRKQLRSGGQSLGLFQYSVEQWRDMRKGDVSDSEQIDALVSERDAARLAKDFARADQIRDELQSQGIVLEDSSSGTRWRRERA